MFNCFMFNVTTRPPESKRVTSAAAALIMMHSLVWVWSFHRTARESRVEDGASLCRYFSRDSVHTAITCNDDESGKVPHNTKKVLSECQLHDVREVSYS